MAFTYIPIATVTVGSGGVADIEFTSIPATHTDLLVKVSLRTARTSDAGGDDLKMYFNGDFGSNYTTRTLIGNGATASSETLSSSNLGIYGMAASNGGTANTFGNGEYYIPNYLSSNNKVVSADTVSETNATTAYMRTSAGLWANTNAITSITFRAGSTLNFLQYSTATLYGIKKD